MLDDFHRLSSASTRETIAWFVNRLPANVQLVLSTRTDPALPLGTLRVRGAAARAARGRAALHGRRGGRVPQRPARPGARPRRRRAAGRPHRGLAGRHLPRRAVAGGREDKHALVTAFDGTSAHVVDFLAGEVLAAHPPELQRFMLRTSVLERLCAPLCDAVLDEPGSADGARLARAHEPLPARAGRPPPLVSLPPPVRPDPARRAREARAASWWPSCTGARTSGIGEFGTTDEAIHHAVAAQGLPGGVAADHRDLGALRQRGPDRVRQRVAGARPRRRRPAAAAGQGVGVRAARARGATCAPRPTRARALGGLDDGPLPDGFVSVESSLTVLEATFGWGDVSAILTHGDALGDARAAGLAVAAGDHLGARLGALLQRRPRPGRALADGDDRDRARGRAVDRRRRRDRRPVADRGPARAPRRAAAAGAGGGRGHPRRRACSTRSRTARCTRPTASRWPRTGALREALLLAREGRLPAPAVGAEARPDRRADRARERRSPSSATASARPRCSTRRRSSPTGAPTRACCPAAAIAAAQAAATPTGGEELSERELTVLRHLAGELSEREIAAELYLSFNTVHSHVKSIYRKLGVSSRAEAVARIHLGR